MSSIAGPSSYELQLQESQRFEGRYYVTALRSPPSAPNLPATQRRYFYLDVRPPASVPVKITLLLLHGFPDSSYGWRNILSPLSLSGYRCIVPDLVGYGRTSHPIRLEDYGAHSQALDLAGLMDEAMGQIHARFAVIGHDWGSWLAWKLCNWIPDRLLGVHGICIPYAPPSSRYVSVQDLAKMFPEYGYICFFEDTRSTNIIQRNLDSFLYRIFSSPKLIRSQPALRDKMGFVQEGLLENSLEEGSAMLPSLSKMTLLTPDDLQMHHLLFDEKLGGDINGPPNWYRTRKVNYEEDNALQTKMLPAVPLKMLAPDQDPTAPLILSERMARFVPDSGKFTIEQVKDCGHWVLLEYPEVVVHSITSWLEADVLAWHSSLFDKIKGRL